MWTEIKVHYLFKKTNKLCAFKSLNEGLYLIYFYKQNNPHFSKGLITYDIIKDQIITDIKEVSFDDIKHYLDKLNKRDLILTSQTKNSLQVWDFRNWDKLVSIENIYNNNVALYSACILNDNKNNYIISSSMNWTNNSSEFIKVYDFEGKFIKEINESKLAIINIDSYFDSKLSKNFIIACSRGCLKSFDFNENKLYKKYFEEGKEEEYDGKLYIDFVIRNNKEITEIFASNKDGRIRVWNFHNGELLNIIKIKTREIYGIFLWKNEYLFAGCYKDHNIFVKKIDLKNHIYKELLGHNKIPYSIKLLNHEKYGDFLISGGLEDIIIWENINSKFQIKKKINSLKK